MLPVLFMLIVDLQVCQFIGERCQGYFVGIMINILFYMCFILLGRKLFSCDVLFPLLRFLITTSTDRRRFSMKSEESLMSEQQPPLPALASTHFRESL